MSNSSTGDGDRRPRRSVIASVVLGLLATLLAPTPAMATGGGGKAAPAVRMTVQTNDDGRIGGQDRGDVGGISAVYDRWDDASSDDPTEPGMDAARIDSDVGRCSSFKLDRDTTRVRIQNAYPGYVCTFAVVTVNKAGVRLIVDDVLISADPTLELVTIYGPTAGDVLKRRKRIHAMYAVVVTQATPQAEMLEFLIEVSFVVKRDRPPPSKCCLRCWR